MEIFELIELIGKELVVNEHGGSVRSTKVTGVTICFETEDGENFVVRAQDIVPHVVQVPGMTALAVYDEKDTTLVFIPIEDSTQT